MDKVAKKYPSSMVRNMGEHENPRPLETIPTGILRLDGALGAGGLARRRGSEIWGPDKAGKTTLASTIMANLSVTPQADGREGGVSVLIDEEEKLDSDYFEQCIVNSGGDLSRCWHVQPGIGAGLDVAFNLIGNVDIIFYDTIAAYTPVKVQDMSDIEGSTWAIEARILSVYLRRINKQMARTWTDKNLRIGTAFVLVNQARVEMNEYRAKYREGLKPWGGKLLKHFRSTQIFMRPYGYGLGKSIFNPDGDDIGVLSKLMVEKNVIGKPHQPVDKPGVLIRFGTGFCPSDDAFKAGVERGLVQRKGNTYSWNDCKLGVGEARAIQHLHENAQVRNELRAEIRKTIECCAA
jgi:recombination protein RecA